MAEDSANFFGLFIAVKYALTDGPVFHSGWNAIPEFSF